MKLYIKTLLLFFLVVLQASCGTTSQKRADKTPDHYRQNQALYAALSGLKSAQRGAAAKNDEERRAARNEYNQEMDNLEQELQAEVEREKEEKRQAELRKKIDEENQRKRAAEMNNERRQTFNNVKQFTNSFNTALKQQTAQRQMSKSKFQQAQARRNRSWETKNATQQNRVSTSANDTKTSLAKNSKSPKGYIDGCANPYWSAPDRGTWCVAHCEERYGHKGTYPESCSQDCYQNAYNDFLVSKGCPRQEYIPKKGPSRAIAE